MNEKLVIIKDFPLIWSKPYAEQYSIFSDLRQAHDGYIEIPFGSGAGKRG